VSALAQRLVEQGALGVLEQVERDVGGRALAGVVCCAGGAGQASL